VWAFQTGLPGGGLEGAGEQIGAIGERGVGQIQAGAGHAGGEQGVKDGAAAAGAAEGTVKIHVASSVA